jgi:hypothetical protein
MSVLNCPPYSAAACAGSSAYACSTISAGTSGFMVRESAWITRTWASSFLKCFWYALQTSPFRPYGDVMHTITAPGTVAIAGRSAARISVSGFALSSDCQNATSSQTAPMTV